MHALDMDGSGHVEQADVEAFALSQGLTAAEARSEFKDVDLNGDGELSAEEIRRTMLGEAQASASLAGAVPQKAEPASLPPAPLVRAAAAHQPGVLRRAPGVNSSFPKHNMGDGDISLGHYIVKAADGAGKALAEAFAQQAARAMDARGDETKKAAQLEAKATSLRGKAEELRRTAAEATRQAASEAAEAMVRRMADDVRAMEAEAVADERAAEERRRQASAAMERVVSAQAEMAADLSKAESKDAP